MQKKLRLILWPDCPRQCPGCCNKDIDLANLPKPVSFAGYDEILLTGGEPLMHPEKAAYLAQDIRYLADDDTRMLMYTAIYTPELYDMVLPHLEGMTVTLHEQSDVAPFMRLYNWLSATGMAQNKSMRLNVFAGIEVPYVGAVFSIKGNITWIKNCPLPEGETLMCMS